MTVPPNETGPNLDNISAPTPERPPVLRESLAGLTGKVALFGGSFDPLHVGHVQVAAAAKEVCGLDTVVFVPAWRNRLKENVPVGSDAERIGLLVAVLTPNPAFCVCPHEITLAQPSSTVKTLRWAAQSVEGRAELYLIIGSDCLESLDRWIEPQEIFLLATPIVIEREGAGPELLDTLRGVLLPAQIEAMRRNWFPAVLNVRSRDIRDRMNRGETLEQLVAPEGRDLLKTYGKKKL